MSSLCPPVFSTAVGEATDDSEREKEDHVFSHLPRHRHHLRGVVALRSYRQNSGRDQTRSAHAQTQQTHNNSVMQRCPCRMC